MVVLFYVGSYPFIRTWIACKMCIRDMDMDASEGYVEP